MSSATKRSTILIAGTGGAARLHTKLLTKRHGDDVQVAHWGRNATAAEQMATGHDGFAVAGSWEEAVADPRIDAVFVTTPPDTHAPMTLAALEAGRHAIVEKPAFLTSEEFDAVEAAAERADRHVLVAENYFYKPLLKRILDVMASGVLGQVRLITINAAKRQVVDGWRADPAQAGGGALFEGGIHWVSFLCSLGLTVRKVDGHFPDAPAGHERSAVFVVEYEEGAVGVLAYSWEIPGTLKGLRLSRIHGTRGSILFESNGLFMLRGGRRLSFPGLSDIQGYKGMLADFVGVLTLGARPEFTLQDARRDVELIRTAYAD